VIHFGAKQIVFADSMGSADVDFCRRLWCLLEVASLVLEQRSFDFRGWSWGSLGRLAPQQPTAYDCGIFAAVLLARSVMHGVKLRPATGWPVADLDAQRRAVVFELLRGRIISLRG